MLNLIDYLKQNKLVQIFTVYLRYLIGTSFIIAAIAMGKLNGSSNLLNSRSFPIDDSTPPLVLFFKVMSESGLYWQFIGWTQIIAGILLLTQRFAKLGALVFFGMILNIFIITISYEFKGTPIVTGLMLLSTIYLILWDARSFQFIIRREGVLESTKLNIADNLYWSWLGIVKICTIIPLTLLKFNMLIIFGVVGVEGLLGLLIFFVRRNRYQQVLPNS